MPLSWNEIKERAVAFSKFWDGTTNEDAEAKSFLEAFFMIFDITRKKVATFEHKVKKLDNHDGYIDLLWKGTLLVEMKSANKDLDKALVQAREYLQTIRQSDLPSHILLCDFRTFRLIDLVEGTERHFHLEKLVENVHYFGFIAGYQKRIYKEQDHVNLNAANAMAKLHDKLKEVGYNGHSLEVYLVRLLFCLFADDTTIFNKDIFANYIKERTSEDGVDLAAKLNELFYILNTPVEKRLKNIDEQLNSFQYINGKLFEETLPPASFDRQMRNILLDCCDLNWGEISPAIFGSMFQSVMNPEERRNLGAHYTSENNILKLIKPLFLDELWGEFEKVKNSRNKLIEFHKKLSKLKFFDPACGCGNFLVITYRELRLLELEILRTLKKSDQGILNIGDIIWLDVDMMYGIEIEEFPAQIAQVAMWLIDHQMNMAISQEFGQYFARLPLKKAATIVNGDSLDIDWETIIPNNEVSYIIGNPPFRGSKKMSEHQRAQIGEMFNWSDGCGVLDFVTGWYIKAAKYINGTKIKVGFVSTNSIVQGEQTSILWKPMISLYGVKIHFAHRTFKWRNEAKGKKAAVYCVIVGFANFDTDTKYIYEYDSVSGEPHEFKVKNINPYLVDAKDLLIGSRSNPISHVPKMSFGNMPLDGGHLLLSDEEKDEFLEIEPNAIRYIKPLISAKEFLNNERRWCLWLVGAEPKDLRAMPQIMERVSNVERFRLDSIAPSTKKFATTPTLFRDLNNPISTIVVPRVSSENRKYIPMGFFDKNHIVGDTCMSIPNGTLYHFGILNSKMHMAWVKSVCGRLKSDFRYSKDIVYNNYPFPNNPSENQIKSVENAAQVILDARLLYPNSSLSDLYDKSMPIELSKAHKQLDEAVDKCYGKRRFDNDLERVTFLFELYEGYTAELFKTDKKKPKKTQSVIPS